MAGSDFWELAIYIYNKVYVFVVWTYILLFFMKNDKNR